MTKNKKLLLTATILTSIVSAMPVQAQNSFDEIIVTAQKKAETLQSVPIAVTAFTGDDIRESGFSSSTDIAAQVPGLNIGTPVGEGNNPSITLRGIGLNDFNDNNEGPVSVYNDGVYVAALPAQTFQLFDLERVEVLRGPQGTLFGRNATGGLIQFISAKPTEDFEAFTSVTVGSFSQVKTESALSGPLTDGVQGRISITTNNHDPYVDNSLGSDGNETDSFSGRAQLNFDIKDKGSFLVRGDYSTSDVASGRIAQEATGSFFNEVFEAPVDNFGFNDVDGDPFDVTQDRTGNQLDVENVAISGTLNYDLTDNLTLTSITAYAETDRLYEEDTDAGPFPGINADFLSNSDQFTQELRIAGDYGKFSFQAGGFYFDSTVRNEQSVNVNQPIEFVDFLDDLPGADGGFEGGLSGVLNGENPFIAGGIFEFDGAQSVDPSRNPINVDPSLANIPISGVFLPFINFDVNYVQETESFAAFYQFDYDLTEQFSFTGGLRYTNDSRDIEYLNAAPAGPLLNDFFSVPGLAEDPDNPEADLFSGAFGSTAGNFFDFTTAGLAARGLEGLNEIDDDAVTGRAVLEYKPTSDALLYASYNRGFKSAGFNTGFLDSSDGVQPESVAYDSETLNAYEIGLKSTWADGRVRVNASGFIYDYNDFQALTFQGLSQFITNADASFIGGEVELGAKLFDGLEADLALSYIDTDVDGVQDLNSGTIINNVEAVLAPNLTLNGALSYETDFAAGSVKGTVDFNYQGEQFFDITNSEVSEEDDYALVNLRLAYTGGDDDQYEIAGFVSNVFDTEYRVYTFDFTGVAGFNQQFFGPPRWFGASFTYNFQ